MQQWAIMEPQFARSYVAGFFDAEGSFNLSKNTTNITMSNTELTLLTFVNEALTVCGLRSRIYSYSTCAHQLRVIGGQRAAIQFAEKIPLQSKRKQNKIYSFANRINFNYVPLTDVVPTAYLAGFFDGEGSVSLYNRLAEVSNCEFDLINFVDDTFKSLNITTRRVTWKRLNSLTAYKLRFNETELSRLPIQSPKHNERRLKPKRKTADLNHVNLTELRAMIQRGEI